MADPFSILGVIGAATKLIKTASDLCIDFKDAPAEARSFIRELQDLKTVLSETHTNLLMNADFVQAFEGRHSALLAQVVGAPSTGTSHFMSTCKAELESSLKELRKKAVEQLHRHCQTLNSLVAIDGAALGAGIMNEVKAFRDEHRDEEASRRKALVLDWLSPNSHSTQHNDTFGRRQPGTCRWFIETPEYQNWARGQCQTLFCPGIPGGGKTILTSIVIDDLTSRFHDDSDTGVAYLYCNFKSHDDQKAFHLLASLLRHLVQKQPSLPASVQSLYDNGKRGRDDVSRVLKSVAAAYARVYVAVDGLDELSRDCRLELLPQLFQLRDECGISLFATARPLTDITDQFCACPWVHIEADKNDMRLYLEANTLLLDMLIKKPDLRCEVIDTIVKAADGMFLLARLHLDTIKGQLRIRSVRKALDRIASRSTSNKRNSYDDAYDDAMERIEQQSEDRRKLARQVLLWIIYAKWPLTTMELQHALTLEPGDRELDEENIPEVQDLVAVCVGLVNVQDGDHVIRLVHYTVQEYVERTWHALLPKANSIIVHVCLSYLSMAVFESGAAESDEAYEDRLRRYSLYEYAAKNWGNHAYGNPSVTRIVVDFLGRSAILEAANQARVVSRLQQKTGYSQSFSTPVHGLHLAAEFSLEAPLLMLLKKSNCRIDCQDDRGRTALSKAASWGYKSVMKILLDNGADIEARDHDDETPLLFAIQSIKHPENATEFLLDRGADIHTRGQNNATPLLCALGAFCPSVALCELLLDRGADLEARDDDYDTPLLRAAGNCDLPYEIVELLLDRGANVEARDKDGKTPLMLASTFHLDETVPKLLLDRGADIKARDQDTKTPLLCATSSDYLTDAIISLLLDRGDDIEARDKNSRTPLLCAAGSVEDFDADSAVKLLLDRGADIEARDAMGKTPLMHACKTSKAVVELLLDRGADIEARDQCSRTPLLHAVSMRHQPEAVIKLFLDRGADMNVRDIYGLTVLHTAAIFQVPSIIQLLSDQGADVNGRDKRDLTPLIVASSNGNVEAARLLIERGSSVDLTDDVERSALHGASDCGSVDTLRLLVQHGADAEARDRYAPSTVEARDVFGLSPLWWSIRTGHPLVSEVLREHGASDYDASPDQDETAPVSREEGVKSQCSEKICDVCTFDIFLADLDSCRHCDNGIVSILIAGSNRTTSTNRLQYLSISPSLTPLPVYNTRSLLDSVDNPSDSNSLRGSLP
ncbi:hypothetical protein CDD80_1894 [Ophiocordyceps camponoti-rufipedis]|uniref:Uncharacterized protein n=1 Tax=Ophiocordyceps camponoti-rufipedis TaxID=2004952 RepID=A0A2C5Z802_9HYPO|nr:hypothetical protein CDD80_1894 [Ophiocordyceps camponoti-rufipedis]